MSRSSPRQAADPLANASLSGWRGALLRLGQRRAVALITLVSVVLSVAMTAAVNVMLDNTDKWPTDLLIAVLVPLLVAPLVSHAALGLLQEVDAARRALHQLAIRDGLTTLYNRRFFMASLQAEASRALRTGSPLSMVMVDVDHFKAINDQLGHGAGDEVLERLASVLTAGLRPYDLSARYGGEEFVALLPGATLAEAEATAERLRVAIEGMRIPGFNDKHLPHVTASMGISCLGEPPDDATALLRRADEGMYAAKDLGRNRCVSVPPPGAGRP